MQFAYPQYRYFLLLAFAAAALAVLAVWRQRRALLRLAQQGIHQPGMLVRPVRQIVKCLLLGLTAGLLGIAVLGPQWGWTEEESPPQRGRDVLIVLDVSRSMLAEDAAPNRLERAKIELRRLADYLERRGGYRIGLITFAERAAVVCPLTFDYRCFAEELAAASLQSLRLRGHAAWGDGTQICRALERAGQAIDDKNAASTDVLLVSDGEDMVRETVASAQSLARRGITVHALGLGDPEHGVLIPVRDRLGQPNYLRYRGELVYTHLQEEVLRAVTQAAHGRYFAAGADDLQLDRQFAELLETKENPERQTAYRQRRGIHRFVWFVGPALLLLLFHGLLSDAPPPGRTAPELPNYFSWVRRSYQSPKRKQGPPSLTLRALFFLLCASVVNSSPPGGPWAAFRRGNALLRQAQQAGAGADPAWLLQAQRQYRACLSCQAATPQANALFADARHNLEMAKLLLMQVSRTGSTSQPAASAEASENTRREKGANAPRSPSEKQSSQQAQQKQQQQQSQTNPGSCTTCQSGQRRAGAQKIAPGGEGARPAPGQAKQPNQTKLSKQSDPGIGSPSSSQQQAGGKKGESGAEKNKTETAKDQAKDPASPQAQQQQQQSQGSSGKCTACQVGQKTVAGGAPRLPGADPGEAMLADVLHQDKQSGRGRGRGEEPDASGLFHPQTLATQQKSSRPGPGSQGDSAGGGPSREMTARAADAKMQAAVLRLQQAIQRIEKRRGRRGNGPDVGLEDPANLHRYRDW